MSNLKDLFLDELADMYDAEKRISKALPKMAKAATSEELKEAFTKHLEETKEQIEKLEQVFATFDEKPKGKTCKATVGLIEEGEELIEENTGEPTINAALISAGQKVEHYEIASYGTLETWARELGNDEAADLISEILEQEKNADETLNDIAEEANQEANAEESEEDSEESEEEKPRRKKTASKR